MNKNAFAPNTNEQNEEPVGPGAIDRDSDRNRLREPDMNEEGQERDTRNPEKENVTGRKVDLDGGHHTNSPGDGEGDRNDTPEMEELNKVNDRP